MLTFDDEILRVPDVCRLYRVSESTVRQWRRKGLVFEGGDGIRPFTRRSVLDRWMHERTSRSMNAEGA